MKKILNKALVFALMLFIFPLFFACSKDDKTPDLPIEVIDENPDSQEPVEPIPDPPVETPDFTPLGTVEIILEDKLDDNYILVNDASNNRVYLMSKEAELLYEWTLTNNIGNDVFLLPSGNLLASLESDDPKIKLGGKGGRLQIIAPDGSLKWDFVYSSNEGETHHDAELLPNGNVLAMVWSRKSAEDALSAGFMLDEDVFPESLIEIDPLTNEIVWEWHSWNHLVQDHDDSKDNFGAIAENPELIDINYVQKSGGENDAKGDIMHANAIAYDQDNDVILLSVNFFSEVWVIDHSTTKGEAAGHTGGNYGKGGDLIYRFGNPTAYENPEGSRIFHNNHFPNLLDGSDKGKLLIFSNGNNGSNQSTVLELELPTSYDLQANTNNELKVTWSFTHPELYSPKVSGAVPLPNGNILITEGTYGYWEVTRDGELVWRCNIQGFHWRGYHYAKDAPEIKLLGL